MNAGRILAAHSPDKLKAQTGAKTIEEAFIALLPRERRAGHQALHVPPRVIHDGQPVIVARELTRRFGKFIAVNRVNFTIERGEIFGFVGSNGWQNNDNENANGVAGTKRRSGSTVRAAARP